MKYPVTKTVSQVDRHHGVSVADPYRWLETDVRQSADVRAWVDEQHDLSDQYLKGLPLWQELHDQFKTVWNTERFGVPVKKGGRYFYSYNDGLMNQSQILTQTSLQAEPTVLLDPNVWSDQGTTALAAYYPGPVGQHVAYMVQEAGSDWRQVRVLDLDTGEDLMDELQWLKYASLSWSKDGGGFYYTRYPEPTGDKFHSLADMNAVYYHRLGTTQSEDRLVYVDAEHPDWRYFTEVTEDGAYLIIGVVLGTDDRYQILAQALDSDRPPAFLIEGFHHDFTPIGHANGELYFRTNMDAPKGRVIALRPELGLAGLADAREVVAENEQVLQGAYLLGRKLVVHYLVDASSSIEVYSLDGAEHSTLALPGLGSVVEISGSEQELEAFYDYSSVNYPPAVMRLDLASLKSSEFRRMDFALDVDDFELKQVFYTSKDGTKVPMFICHKRGLVLDGSHPTLLYGYGGFNISLTPSFSISRAVWIERGGVAAIANLRGGGEYGETWHRAGTRLKKQNVFDDFIAAGEYLVETGYTAPAHLGIMGGSNGGLLVGAVLNQRPDLFGAALPIVGVMDMLRFHLFTAGAFWVDDYGSAENADEFAALYAYSPYHNLVAQAYPPTLVATADTDDRVVPGHSFKYAARLQEMQTGKAPVLLRVETDAGHGAGTPIEKIINEYTDYWTFLLHHLQDDAGQKKADQ
jgi:prolyl oligopeptidase